jgi:predicted amino acid racemase
MTSGAASIRASSGIKLLQVSAGATASPAPLLLRAGY